MKNYVTTSLRVKTYIRFLVLVLLFTFLSVSNSMAQNVFFEGFESGHTNGSAITGWTQASVTGTGVVTANNSLTTYNRTPRTGTWDAYLVYSNTRWIFKSVTLTGGTTYQFQCYAKQDGSTTTNASIKLAYGTTASAAGMTNTIVNTTGFGSTYTLISGTFTPATTGTYYMGILGTINSTPWYITIDDISLDALVPMSYTSSTTTQNTGVVPSTGAALTNQQVIGVQVVTTGALTPLSLTQLDFSTNGTTNLSNITNAKVYSTGTSSTFATTTQFGSTTVSPNGAFSVTGSLTLSAGTNYLWLTYDLPANPTVGDVLDAECTGVTVAGTGYAPTVTAPAGSRAIKAPLSGTYTINPSGSGSTNYTTFASAVSDLSALGLSGPVVFNVSEGTYTEGGLNLSVTGTASNTITFQKAPGAASNPIIQANTGTGSTDYILQLTGSDYITFDGINFSESASNTTSTTWMEKGISIVGTATDGCKNNTFKNGTITLNKTNTNSTYGVYFASVATAATGSNSNNSFLNMTVTNVLYGYYLYGNSVYYDDANTVSTTGGGTSTISNFGSTLASYAVYVGYQTNLTISNTTFTNATATAASIYGIYTSVGANNTVTYSGNTFSSFSNTSSATYLISHTAGLTLTANNNSASSITATTGSIYGIQCTAGTLTANSNVFTGFSTTGTSNTATMYGIYVTGTTATLLKNKIYGFTSSASAVASYVTGVYTSATTLYLQNNMIYNLSAAGSTGAPSVKSIHLVGGTNAYIQNNTVMHSGTPTNASYQSALLYIPASLTTNIYLNNNIFVNKVDVTTTGTRTVAVYRASATTGVFPTTNSNNVWYAGTPGTKQLIHYDGTNSDQTLAAWTARLNSSGGNREAASLSENVPFVGASDVHINPAVATSVESGGIAISTPLAITTDIDGDTRNATTPDIGADEGAFTPLDVVGPTITLTTLSNTSSTSARELDVTITDPSGVPEMDPSLPMVYWRIGSSGGFNSAQGVPAGSGVFRFSLGSGVVLNDVVQYYVVAQDAASNISCLPSTGASGFSIDPPAAATPPTTPYSYTIIPSMSGTKTVGTGGDYTTLTLAAAALNAAEITGAVVLSLTDATYASETLPITINALNGTSAAKTVTIKPASGVNATISGSSTTSVIKLNGADYVIIDGSNDGSTSKNLTITNTNTVAATGAVWIASTAAGAGATHDVIKNCNISNGSTTVINYGVCISSTSAMATAGDNNDYTTIQNNSITKSYYGVYAYSNTATKSSNLVITGNSIGNATAANSVSAYGIKVIGSNSATISSNTLTNITHSTLSINNTAIELGDETTGSLISSNIIHGVSNTNSSGYGAFGINLAGTTNAGSVTIINNSIDGISTINYSSSSTTYNPFAIRIGALTGVKVYFNSINMYGPQTATGSAATLSAALLVTGATTNLDIRNNNIVNNLQSTITGSKMYAIYIGGTLTTPTINYNDYYAPGYSTTTTGLVGYYTADQATLAAWKAAVTADVNSINTDPLYNSNTFLQPQLGSPVLGGGTTLAGYTTDITGSTRTNPPAIGAYDGGTDVSGPTLTFTDLSNIVPEASRILPSFLTATDVSSVNTTAGLLPRIYFKKSADANAFVGNTSTDNGWKWVEATNAASPFDFTIDFSLLYNSLGGSGSIVKDDIVQYFVVAQDLATTPNVSASPSTGFVGTTVASITVAPTTPKSFTVVDVPMHGTYTVGAAKFNSVGNKRLTVEKAVKYKKIAVDVEASTAVKPAKKVKSAIDVETENEPIVASKKAKSNVDLMSNSVADEVEVKLYENNKPYTGTLFIEGSMIPNNVENTNGVYATLSAAIADLNLRGVDGAVTLSLVDATYSESALTVGAIVGTSATNTITIKPSSGVSPTITVTSATGALTLNGTDYLTIDGSNNGSTSRDMTIVNSSTGTTSAVIWGQSGATNNVIKNLNITGNASTTTLFGVGFGGTTISTTSLGASNNSNTIQNNIITKVQMGVYVKGASSASKDMNNTITSNTMTSNVGLVGVIGGYQDGLVVSNNSIAGLSNASSSTVGGIFVGFNNSLSGSSTTGYEVTNAVISNNFVNGASQTGTYSAVGIALASSTTGTSKIYNNVITGITSNSTSGDVTFGILVGGGTVEVTHNSVYMSGSRGTADQYSVALGVNGTTPAVTIKNNILVNTQTSTSTGTSYAIGLGYTSTAGAYANLVSTNNDIYTGQSTFAIVGSLNVSSLAGTGKATLAAWNTETGQDAVGVSISADPLFNGLSNLMPQTGSPVLGTGTPIAYVTTDITGAVRSGTAPSMGAYENGQDGVAPTVTIASAIGNTVSVATVDLTGVVITDASGVNTSSNTKPRVYYKKSGNSNAFVGNTSADNGWKYVETSSSSTPFSFTLDFSKLYNAGGGAGSLADNDVIQYFVVAQDLATPTPNAGAAPSTGFVGTSVSTITSAPTTPNSFTVLAGLNGTFTVAAGSVSPNYATLTAAFADINAKVLTGPVVLLLQDATYSTSETFPLVLNSNGGSSSTNTITIKPQTASGVTISGSASASGLIKLNGAKYVIIDGSSSGGTDRGLTINNTTTTTSGVGIWLANNGTSGTDHITLKNLNITGTNSSTSVYTYGVFAAGTTISTSGTGDNHDNLTIQNNLIKKAYTGIYVASTATGTSDNLVISGNTLGSETASEYLLKSGIELKQATAATVTGNTIKGVVSSVGNVFGMLLNTVSGSTITRNSIRTISYSGSTGYGGKGIDLQTVSTTTIANNMVTDIKGDGYNSLTGDAIVGLRIVSGTSLNVYNNTVNIAAAQTHASATISAAGYVGTGSTIIDMRNNIFVSSATSTATTPKTYAFYSAAANTAFSNINNNLYYVNAGTQGVLGFLGVDCADLTALRTATSQDGASVSGDPLFHNVYNVHVLPISALVSNAGAALAGISPDIDGDVRSASTPDIGADEFEYRAAGQSGSAPAPTVGNNNPVIATTNPGGVTFNPSAITPTTATIVCQFFPSGRSGNIPGSLSTASPYYWALSTNATSFTGAVRFYYDQIPGNNVTDPSHISVLKRDGDGSTWAVIDPANLTWGSDAGGNYFEVANLTGFSEFSFGSNDALPVELSTINATAKERNVNVDWTTKTEVKLSKFEVERSVVKDNEPATWSKVGEVKASGNSNITRKYNFTDSKLNAGNYQYRLKLVDISGEFRYSDVVTAGVELPKNYQLSQNYPNPFNPSTRVDYQLPFNAKVVVELYNISGEKVAELVNQEQAAGYYTIDVRADQLRLASGIYIYRMVAQDNVKSESFKQIKKMVLLK